MSIAQHVERQVGAYLGRHPEDRTRLTALLSQMREEPESLLSRKCMRGHITTSGIVLDPTLRRILEISHIALGRWLQPGGHYEAPGTLFANACREPVEETGVRGLRPLISGRQMPLDIDTHPIPANPAKDEGAHFHHDFAYAMVAGDTEGLVAQEDEVSGIRWTPIADFARRDARAALIAHRLQGILS